MTAPITLSIAIVNWNTRELLAQCLQSVYDTADDLEVIVVDNASTDGSQAMVHNRFPQTQLIKNQKNVGFARANNQAIRASQGRYVLLLNSDTIVQPGALETMVYFANRHLEAGVVGCKLLNADGSLQPSWAQFPTFWSELTGRHVRKRRPIANDQAFQVDWVGGACLLARRKAIETVGLLDENFFMYSEETDWCFRMAKSAWKIYYLSDAEVIHFGGGSSQQASAQMLTQLYQSKLRFFRKHHGALPALGLGLALFLTNLLRLLFRLPWRLGGRYKKTMRFKAWRTVLVSLFQDDTFDDELL